MNIVRHNAQAMPLPAPCVQINIRVATMADLPFLDTLQKKHNRALGYFPTKQFEGYIEMGAVLVAEAPSAPQLLTTNSQPLALGYIISRDRYLKRDELGVIYQLCVSPNVQRKLIGASLVRAAFERAAYGCRLFCCWCAQDLGANYFWESLGFVPIAFRGGAEKKKGLHRRGRVHIFWQKRIREGDITTPWWFPARTDGGALREDRLVLPIPPGLHWRDEMPVLMPEQASASPLPPGEGGREAMRSGRVRAEPRLVPGMRADPQAPTPHPRKRVRVQFAPPSATPVAPPPPPEPASLPTKTPPVNRPRPRSKCDPKHIALARELRDRYLEEVNLDPTFLLPSAKYEVARAVPESDRSLTVAARPERGSLPEIEVKALPEAA
jgi:ribosomal protein S18 acetylase RimI-like enzyme